MKSQGLPLQTIVILVLVIVSLAAILMFFFGGFGKSGASLNDQQALSKCQSRCTRARTFAIALDKDQDNINNTIEKSSFCNTTVVEGSGVRCDKITSCKVLFKNQPDECTLHCNTWNSGTCS